MFSTLLEFFLFAGLFLGDFCMYLVTVRDDYFWYETIIANCTSCKSSYNGLSHSHWGLGQFLGSRGGAGVC